jgi:hypothetical protein
MIAKHYISKLKYSALITIVYVKAAATFSLTALPTIELPVASNFQ